MKQASIFVLLSFFLFIVKETERQYSMPTTPSPGGEEKAHIRVTMLCKIGDCAYLRFCNNNPVSFPNKS